MLAAGPCQLRGSCTGVLAAPRQGARKRPRRLRGGVPVGVCRGQERQQRRRLAQRRPSRHNRHQAPVQHCLPRRHHLWR